MRRMMRRVITWWKKGDEDHEARNRIDSRQIICFFSAHGWSEVKIEIVFSLLASSKSIV